MRSASLLLAFLMLAATGFVGYVTVERMRASRELVLHTYYVRGLLLDLRAEIGETHAGFDLFALSRNPNEAEDLKRQAQEEVATLQELQNLTRDNPPQQARLKQFRNVMEEDLRQLRECVAGANCLGAGMGDETDQIMMIAARRRVMSAMLQNLEIAEAQLLQERLDTWNRLFTRVVITLIGCFVLALALVIYNFNLLIREVEQRKEQEWIEKKNAESYRLLSARILELQDVERRKIARELHDSVGQFLAGLKLNLGRLQRRDLEAGHPNGALVAESLDLTDRAITEVRTISHLLHPPLLDELGFHSAARWYTEGFAKRSGIHVQLELREVAERMPKEVELALFRVLQEALTNVHRHAQATRVDIEVECADHQVTLGIRDDGKGIHRSVLEKFRAGEAGGIGLAGMRERLAELGGMLSVESSATGTQIRATLPTEEFAAEAAAAEHATIPTN